MTWRRWVVGAAAVGAAAIGVPIALIGWTFSGGGAIVDGQALPGGAVVVQDGYGAAFLVPLPDGAAALVDAGMDPEGASIRAALERSGRTEDDVAAVLLTHGHGDHTGACARYRNATVYVAKEELPLLSGQVAPKGPLPRLFGASPSPCAAPVGVEDGQVVSVHGVDATAYLVPGHTAGSTVWRVGPVLYLGDSADATSDGRLVGSKWVFSDDTDQNAQSLRALAARLPPGEIRALACSHTGVLNGIEPLTALAATVR